MLKHHVMASASWNIVLGASRFPATYGTLPFVGSRIPPPDAILLSILCCPTQWAKDSPGRKFLKRLLPVLGAQAARGAEAGDGQQAGRNEAGAGGERLRPGGGEEVGAEEGGGGAASGDTEERGRHFGVWLREIRAGAEA